ncbi:uncharacterized protein LOC109817993 [Cajanus cajan]|uniref:uncharacterized protein LOC109817987 n=1 Tax=Cajanus cajan TaxID=3821 RepID=UPI00098DCB41|nr:uncharacterized protein LOC109817987 [Cajanus cajan]XP_020238952.1 uncharacterized protein LOC109817993 [Cajanus cajan]
MAALREENAALKKRNQDPTWKPSEPTHTQGSFHSHGHHTSLPHTSVVAPGNHASAAHVTGQPAYAPPTGAHRHPFTPNIMQSSLLDHWKFLTQVTLSTTDDVVVFHIFPTSLKGRALSWFTRLLANSIDSFNTLASQFTIQFATSRPHQLTSLALHLQETPSDMDNLRRRADKYIQMEELAEFRNQAKAEVAAKAEKPAESSYQSCPKDLVPRDKPIRGPRYSHYTPLNASRSAVLDQALASEVLAVPKRASTLPRADTSKSCKYHHNRGH